MKRIPSHFRRFFLLLNTILVAIAGGVMGTFLFLHRDDVALTEVVLFSFLVFVLLPGLVFLLYRRFKDALVRVVEADAEASAQAESREVALAQVLDSVIDPILSIDTDGTVLTANTAVEKIWGWKVSELLGQNVSILMAEPYRSEHDGYIESYLKTGQRKAIGRVRKVLGIRKSGAEFPCEISISEVRVPAGVQFVGVIRDISEREEMSARLAQAERLAAVGELAAGVAHEVNNPVNTIINCAQLLKDGDTDPSLHDDIMHEGMRIASIVRDLLDFARDHKDQHSPTRIKDVIDRTLSLVSGRIEKQGIALKVRVPDDLPQIKGRSQQLQQVLLNLLLNARDALVTDLKPEPKEIEISASADDVGDERVLAVRVRDNGPGIPPSDIERIFQPFFTTKRDRGGTGLGLAVSLGIVKSHHGALKVRSSPGEFTEFAMELPVDNGWAEASVESRRTD